MIGRIALALAGGCAAGWGMWLLISHVSTRDLVAVVCWLAVAVVLHDVVWSPTLVGIGAGLSRVAPRERRFLQGGLVVAASLVVVAVPLIMARGRQPGNTTILTQDVPASLLMLLGVVTAATAASWLICVLRDRRRASRRRV